MVMKVTFDVDKTDDGRYCVRRVEWLGNEFTFDDKEDALRAADRLIGVAGKDTGLVLDKTTMVDALYDIMLERGLVLELSSERDTEMAMYCRTILIHYMLAAGYTMPYICRWMKRPSYRKCVIDERYTTMHGNPTYPEFNEIENQFLEKIRWDDLHNE